MDFIGSTFSSSWGAKTSTSTKRRGHSTTLQPMLRSFSCGGSGLLVIVVSLPLVARSGGMDTYNGPCITGYTSLYCLFHPFIPANQLNVGQMRYCKATLASYGIDSSLVLSVDTEAPINACVGHGTVSGHDACDGSATTHRCLLWLVTRVSEASAVPC